jgi:RES domain-containing protein
VPGWDGRDSPAARAFGDRWHADRRSVALVVPALPAKPIGRTVLVNPLHPDFSRVRSGKPFPVPWDERLF